MRPVPIPAAFLWPGSRRVVMAAPGGDLTDPSCPPVEVLADNRSPLVPGGARYFMRVALEEGDLALLIANGGHFWLSLLGVVPPSSHILEQPLALDESPGPLERRFAADHVSFVDRPKPYPRRVYVAGVLATDSRDDLVDTLTTIEAIGLRLLEVADA